MCICKVKLKMGLESTISYTIYIFSLAISVNSLYDFDAQHETTTKGGGASANAITESVSTTTLSTASSSSSLFPSAEQRAFLWLFTQRDPRNYGFRNDTALVLITMQMARSMGQHQLPTVPIDATDVALSGKQLELETVVSLWRHSAFPPSPLRLALSCLALSAFCRDPRQFHGHDLIGTLLHHHQMQDKQLQSPLRDTVHGEGDGDGSSSSSIIKEATNFGQHLNDLEFGYVILAACAARAHVRKKDVQRLLDIAGQPQRHNIDTLSITIITLRCIIIHDHRHRNWLHSIRKPSISLARQQLVDGSFGNVYNTALAMQALAGASSAAHVHAHSGYWRLAAARGWLELHQDPDGAFTDPGLTAMAIIALMGKGMDVVRTLADSNLCMGGDYNAGSSSSLQSTDIYGDIDGVADGSSNFTSSATGGGSVINMVQNNSPPTASSDKNASKQQYYLPNVNTQLLGNQQQQQQQQQQPYNITVSYTLWLGNNNSNGSNVTVPERTLATASITTPAARNATFYTVMVLAAELDPPHFAFEASQWPNGHYVHTIAGHKEEPMGYHYWLLYRLHDKPDAEHPPSSNQVAPVGVDELIIEDGDHFLFWYKKL